MALNAALKDGQELHAKPGAKLPSHGIGAKKAGTLFDSQRKGGLEEFGALRINSKGLCWICSR